MREAKKAISTNDFFPAFAEPIQKDTYSRVPTDSYSLNMTITPKEDSALSLSETIPISLKKYVIPGTSPFVISGQFGNFIFQELKFDDNSPYIWYNHYFLAREEIFTFFSKQAHLRLQFGLSNNFYTDLGGIGKWKISQGTYNLFFVPFLNKQVSLRPGKAYTELNVYFQPWHLVHLAHYNALLETFLQKVALGQASLLHLVDQPLTEAMERIIREILASHVKGPMQPVYLETKINELLLVCLDPQDDVKVRSNCVNQETETEKLMEAKKIWLDNIQDPLSLAVLSKKIGLNVRKLKIGFKKLFGHSPYDLLLNIRMERAERLLSETNLSISAIAESVGYTGVQSFCKAFKLFFKMSPLQYRKQNPLINN